MAFIADTHVHLYPFFDLTAALRGALQRLGALAPGLPRAIFLTERSDCHFFRDMYERLTADASNGASASFENFQFARAGENALVATTGGEKLFIIAGRQIATVERLEVHSLAVDVEIPDGLPLADAIARVCDAGGVPVIPWGVGKWLGARGRLVRDALEKNADVLAGDSSMRPTPWPEPCFRSAALRVIAGTDPLPVRGEEQQIGRYATIFDGDLDGCDSAASVRNALRRVPQSGCKMTGYRCGPIEVFTRSRAMKNART